MLTTSASAAIIFFSASPTELQDLPERNRFHSRLTNHSHSIHPNVSMLLFTPVRRNIDSDRSFVFPPLNLKDQPIVQAVTVKYLGLLLSHKLSWTPHIGAVFGKVQKLSFFAQRLISLGIPQFLIKKLVFACILLHWLYLSPVFFLFCLKNDLTLLVTSLKHVARRSGIPRSRIGRAHYLLVQNSV